jgi:hypothetical protein
VVNSKRYKKFLELNPLLWVTYFEASYDNGGFYNVGRCYVALQATQSAARATCGMIHAASLKVVNCLIETGKNLALMCTMDQKAAVVEILLY